MRRRLIAVMLIVVMLFTFTACEKQYTIKFDTDGGSAVEDVVGGKGKIIEESPGTTRPGYTFAGWYDGEVKVSFPYNVAGNKTLKAKWDIITYNAIFNSNGGLGEIPGITYTVEEEIWLDDPDEDIWPAGMTFAGWYNAVVGGTNYYVIEKGSTGDKEFWARWTETAYEITYNTNGGTLANETKTYTMFETVDIFLQEPIRATYDFEGWFDNPALDGAKVTHIIKGSTGDKEFWAKWKVASYKITYNLYGSLTQESNYTYSTESAFTLLTPSERAGYDFQGWYDNGLLNGSPIMEIAAGSTGNKTFWAKWSAPKSYTITYNLDGGTNNPNNPDEYTVETGLITLQNPTRLGYTFRGWFDNPGFSGTAITQISAGSTGFKAFWAKWEIITYTITYRSGEDTLALVPNSYTVAVGVTLPMPDARVGYAFAGWYNNAGFTGSAVTQIAVGNTGNRTLYAKWDAIVYTITYNDGYGVPGGSYTIEDSVTLPTPEREGYTFRGWFDNETLNGTAVLQIIAGSTGNKVFWAKWEQLAPDNYSITYHLNGGTNNLNNPATYTAESGLINLQDPTRTGCTFQGWFDNSTFNGTAVTEIAAGSTGNKVFWAKWQTIKYTITYNLYSGVNNPNNPEEYTVETGLIVLRDPTRAGYVFEGWYNNASFTGAVVTQIAAGATGNRTLHAKWEAITYTITYNDGYGVPGGSYTIEDSVTLPTPERSGYDFLGWFDNSGFTGTVFTEIPAGSTGDMVFWAKWEAVYYTIVYNYSDLTDGTYTAAGLPFILPTPDVRVGFTFEGWYNNPNFAGSPVTTLSAGSAGDIELWALWKSNDATVYTIEYRNIYGYVWSGPTKNTYSPSEAPFALPTPVRTNYEFIGWSTTIGGETFLTVTADFSGNLILFDNWIGAEYTITLNLNGGSLENADEDVATVTYRYAPPVATGNFSAPENNFVLPTPVKEGATFGGWYANQNLTDTDLTKPGSGAIGTLLAGATGNKVYYAKWLSGSTPIKTETFEAENTDLTNKSGSGWSGNNNEHQMLYRDPGASGGMYLAYLNDDGAWVDFYIFSDRAITATLTVVVNFECIIGVMPLKDIEIFYSSPESFNYKICVNGKYYNFRIVVTAGDNPNDMPYTSLVIENVDLVAGLNAIFLINGPNVHWLGERQAGPGVDCIMLTAAANLSWRAKFDYSHLVD